MFVTNGCGKATRIGDGVYESVSWSCHTALTVYLILMFNIGSMY